MNRSALWSTALLMVALSGASFVSELRMEGSKQAMFVPAIFVLLSVLTAVGLIQRVRIARPVASILYLLTALAALFQVVVLGLAAVEVEPLDWELIARFALSAIVLILVVWSLWWLTSRRTIEAFRNGGQP